jgi:hypothetical protein
MTIEGGADLKFTGAKMQRASILIRESPSGPLLESLSDSRISILYLARQAKEAKDSAVAKELTAKAQSLRQEITRIRQTSTSAWTRDTKTLMSRAGTAQSELAKLIQDADKSAKKTKHFSRALGAVSTILAIAKKVL